MTRVEDPTQSASMEVNFPNPLVLPVAYDENGRAYPAAGVTFQRVITLDQLDAMGVSYRWQTQDGTTFPSDDAKTLVTENEERAANGILPQQLLAHPHGDHT